MFGGWRITFEISSLHHLGPKDEIQVFRIGGKHFTQWAPSPAQNILL